jgi:hypothetical protein
MSDERAQIRGPIFPKEYMIKDSEHINELPEFSLARIGHQFNERMTNGTHSWLALASALDIDKGDIAEIWKSQNPGFEVLKKWRKKPYSTVKVICQIVQSLDRKDVIPLIEECQLDLIQLVISLNYSGDEVRDLSGMCPSRMPIIECVCLLISDTMAPDLIPKDHDQCVIIHMRRSDVTWTSLAKKFQAQLLTLEVVFGERNYSERQRLGELNRCIIREISGVCFRFENNFDLQVPVQEECGRSGNDALVLAQQQQQQQQQQ